MTIERIYRLVLDAVEAEIRLDEGWLLSSKTEDSTDARYILCGFLHKYGLSSAHIQKMTGLKKSTVNKMIASLGERLDRRRITSMWWLQIDRRLSDENGVEKLFG